MNFKLFIERTISEMLPSFGEDAKLIKKQVKEFLQNHLQGRDLDTAVNLFTYIYYKEGNGNIKEDWETFRDYLTVNLTHNRTLFVNHITRDQLENLNDRYHLNLKLIDKNLRKGPKGENLVNVSKELLELNKVLKLSDNFKPDLWHGWNWVSLGCGYSSQEAAAGGHCGNVGANPGDNIFSLRNPNNQVLLTFVVNINTGHLGESKALNNEKPKRDLHPAIVALLSSKYVKKVEGGGYLPEKNFHLSDLEYNKQLYDYFLNHLSDSKEHKKPENYLPLSWLTSLSDDIVHVKYHTIEQKTKLLEDILNVFSNYRVFDLDEKDKFKPIPIRVNLNKLIKDCLNSKEAQNVKYLLDMYSKVVNIYSSNKIWGDYDIDRFRPDLNKNEIPQDKDGVPIEYTKKIESINVDQSTIDSIIKNILSKKLNLRDKVNFLSTTQRAAGHGYGERPGSYFNQIINNTTDQLIKDVLSAQKIPEYTSETLIDYIERNISEEDMTGLVLSFYPKSQSLRVKFHQTHIYYDDEDRTDQEKKSIDVEIKKILPEFKRDFIKKGIPADRGDISNYIAACCVKNLEDKFFKKVIDTLFMNYSYAKSRKSNYLSRGYDVKDIIRKIISGEKLTFARDIKNDISDCREKILYKFLKSMKKLILQIFDEVCDCTKELIKKYRSRIFVGSRKHRKKYRYETDRELDRQRIKAKYALLRSKYAQPTQQAESLNLSFRNWILFN